MSDWDQISMVLQLTATVLKGGWDCEMPPFDSLPNEALEKDVDEWCSKLAGNLMAPIDPPDVVKPWVLARLAVASVEAGLEAAEQTKCPGLSPESVRNMLIVSWHDGLRDKWGLMVTLGDDSCADC